MRVPVGARASAGAAAHRQGAEADETARLAAAWAREAPAAYHWRQMPMQASGTECGDCGEPAMWHSAHAALVCLGCDSAIDSPGVTTRAEAHAAALARRKARAAGTMPAIESDPGAEARARAERVQLHRNREALDRYARTMIAMCDGDAYERSQFARLAFEIGATIRGYLAEIARADSTQTLYAILAELKEIREGDEYRSLTQEAAEQNERQERAEIAAERAERAAEIEAERQAAAQAAWEAQERARAAAEAQRQRAERQPRQLPASRPAYPSSPTLQAAQLIALAVAQRRQHKDRQEALRQQNGTCGWCQRTATRTYGIGDYSGNINRNYPSAGACARHHATADAWIDEQAAAVSQWSGAKAYYWELATA